MQTSLVSYRLPNTEHKQVFLQATFFTGIAFLIMLVHVALGAALGAAGFVWILAVTGIFIVMKPDIALTIMLVGLFLQNIFVAIVSPEISDYTQYGPLMATSFLSVLLTSLICIPVWLNLRGRFPPQNIVLLRWILFFFILVAFYSALGMVSAKIAYVLLYARIYVVGGLLLVIGLAFGVQNRMDYAINIIRLLAAIMIVWGFVEFMWPREVYNFFNVVDYFRLKTMYGADTLTIGSADDLVTYSSRSYLNLTGFMGLDFQLLRPNGPNLHPITYAYCMLFCCLVCFICRSYLLTIGCAALVVLIGAKGPLVVLFLAFSLYYFYNLVRNPRWLALALIGAMLMYAAVGIVYGLITQDYHVIGFLGGIRGFMHNPFGHGVGVGGSLSAISIGEKTTDYQFLQDYGADYGFESALGVLLYQMGIGIGVFLYLYWLLWRSVWKAALYFSEERRLMIVPIVFALLLVNGIFQEEALSPSGWGLWLLFSGLLVAQQWRRQMDSRPLPEPETALATG